MFLNHFFKGCNVFPAMQFYDFEWFSWFPIIPVTNFQFVTNISGDMIEMRKKIKHLYASESLLKVVMHIRNAILWFWVVCWFLSFLLLIFNLWLTFSGDMIEMRKKIKTLICFRITFLKVVMYFRNAILWFLSGLVDSPIIPVTNFQFVTNISGDMIEMRKNTYNKSLFLKVVMHFRNAILWFFEWFSWFPIIPVTNFQFVTNISEDMIEMRKIK